MPEPLHPPYGITQPRQLQRWLDVNSQNGPLGRTRQFITIPTDAVNPPIIPVRGITIINNGNAVYTFKTKDYNGNFIETVFLGQDQEYTFTNFSNIASIRNTTLGIEYTFPIIGWTGVVFYNPDNTYTAHINFNASNKIFQFNYQSANNFSLLLDANFDNFVSAFQGKLSVCIANIFANGLNPNLVNRYRLTQESLETTYCPQYTGQKILGKYFQIEFWTLLNYKSGTIQPSGPYTLYTSKRGNLDYRYGLDFSAGNGTLITNFTNTSPSGGGTFNLPITFNQNTINGTN